MVFHIPKFLRAHKSVKIFTGQGIEKNNDYARNIVLRKSNKWDAASDVLKVEARQWALQSQIHFSNYLSKPSTLGSFAFQPVTASEVELEILSTPHNKAYGLFSCPIPLLKCASKTISKPLCKIINDSITSGVFPSRLKHAKVIPIYKNDDVTDPNNYRPISLLSVFNRIIEKLIYRQLKSFLEDCNIFYHSQYGFRERRSTEHALIDIVNQIQSNFDKGIYTCGIFIDLKKAFDTVDHSILLQKLYHYGIRGIVNDWFRFYLSDRIQSTQIGPNISNKQRMTCGVPQGSVLDLYSFSYMSTTSTGHLIN